VTLRFVGAAGGPPASLTVKTWPPTVIFPTLMVDPVLAAAVKLIVAFPLPVAGDAVSHVESLDAVHEQPSPAVRVNEPVPPVEATSALEGDNE
jgi:hypothetical protein